MAAGSVTDSTLLDILARLEPGDDLDRSLRKLLTEKARHDLMKYRLIDQRFHRDYGMAFLAFKASDRMKQPTSSTEQDYFDWEMAVTMIDELEDTLRILQETTA